MARTPSYSLSAQDAIGQALHISSVKPVEDRAARINDYNMAIAEIYLILGFIDTEAYTKLSPNLPATMYSFPKCGYVNIDTLASWDKILEVEALDTAFPSLPVDNLEKVDYSTFSSHRPYKAAIDPYDESVIYTIVGNRIYFLIGESLEYRFDNIQFKIVYRRQPSMLDKTNWVSEKIDLPDKYWSLLVNRMASLIEFRSGVVDKALAMVKMSYEQLLSTVDPVIKASIMKSLETPVGAIQ